MRKAKICLSFSNYSDADLLAKAEAVLQGISTDPSFINPNPSLAQARAAVTEYAEAMANAAGRDRTAVIQKNQSRERLEVILEQLGMYVTFIAMGNAEVLSSSGFTLAKMPEPKQLTTPGFVTFHDGITSGQLVTSVATIPAAVTYLHEIMQAPFLENSTWISTPSTKSKYTYNDLEPGKKYLLRVVAIGRDNQVACGPITTTEYIR